MPKKSIPDEFSDFPVRLKLLMNRRKVIKNNRERPTSQQDLAEQLGIKRQTVSLYLTGQSVPDALQIRKIAQFFNVSTDYLLGLAPAKSTDMCVRDIVEYTGLTEETVNVLHNFTDSKTLSSFFRQFFGYAVANEATSFLKARDYIISAAFALNSAPSNPSDEDMDSFVKELTSMVKSMGPKAYPMPAWNVAEYFTEHAKEMLKEGIDQTVDDLIDDVLRALNKLCKEEARGNG